MFITKQENSQQQNSDYIKILQLYALLYVVESTLYVLKSVIHSSELGLHYHYPPSWVSTPLAWPWHGPLAWPLEPGPLQPTPSLISSLVLTTNP